MLRAKKIMLATLMVVLVVTSFGLGTQEALAQSGKSNVLVVYTSRSEQLNDAIIPKFEKDTGIKVEVVAAGTGELQTRIASEKNNPLGDVFWGADETMLMAQKDLFYEYVSPHDEFMLEGFKNTTGYFTPVLADGSVIMVNRDLVGDMKIEGYMDLLNPELKGRIAFSDPTRSSCPFQVLVNMLYDFGKDNDPTSKEAWDYVDQFIVNLDGKIQSSSSKAHKATADGEYAVVLTWEDPAATYFKNGANIEVVFPIEGVILPGESVQIIKGAKNLENAKLFVDYLLSEEIQTFSGTQLTNRPLRENIPLSEWLQPIEELNLNRAYDIEWVAANKKWIVDTWIEHLEEMMY